MAGVENSDAEQCLRTVLNAEGYELSPERRFGENGVDVIASRGANIFHIEVIGYKSSGPARAKDFYESFFRIIYRLKDGVKKCVIAMSINAKIGLPARANQYGAAWDRIGSAFPELEIWLIDNDGSTIFRCYRRCYPAFQGLDVAHAGWIRYLRALLSHGIAVSVGSGLTTYWQDDMVIQRVMALYSDLLRAGLSQKGEELDWLSCLIPAEASQGIQGVFPDPASS